MNGKTETEILEEKEKIIEKVKGLGVVIVNSYFGKSYEKFAEESVNKGIYYLSKSLEVMSKCDAMIFAKGWEEARGCRIEHEVAKSYGLEIF